MTLLTDGILRLTEELNRRGKFHFTTSSHRLYVTDDTVSSEPIQLINVFFQRPGYSRAHVFGSVTICPPGTYTPFSGGVRLTQDWEPNQENPCSTTIFDDAHLLEIAGLIESHTRTLLDLFDQKPSSDT